MSLSFSMKDRPNTKPTTLSVLVVDDEEPMRQVMSRMLTAAGYHVTLAGSGREALERFTAAPSFDLLVTDLFMPGMEGDELARQLRMVQPDLKVLYVTGFADRLFEHRPLLWDGEAYLDKPFTRLGLLEAAALVLDDTIVERAPEPRPRLAGHQTLIWH
jgi:CheY-like chemotaxis protein